MSHRLLRALCLLLALTCGYLFGMVKADGQRPITWDSQSTYPNGTVQAADGLVPTGGIIIWDGASCPAGYAEVAALDGQTPLGTLAAHADVGTTGGADNITPAGTNSAPTFTGSALAAHSHTFIGNAFTDIINHTHPVNLTDNGHSHTWRVGTAVTGGLSGATWDTSTSGGPNNSGYTTTTNTTGITAASSNPAGGVASITPAGANSSDSAGTPTGTVSAPGFTGTQFDNRSAFLRVLYCKKT